MFALALLVRAGVALADTISVTSADQYLESTVNVTSSDTVVFTNGIDTCTFGGLTGDGTIALTNLDASCVTLRVGGTGTNTTFAGILGGCGGLTKVGGNTFTLANTNTYGGATVVSAGKLKLAAPLPAVTGTRALWLDATTLALANGSSVGTWASCAVAGETLKGSRITHASKKHYCHDLLRHWLRLCSNGQ